MISNTNLTSNDPVLQARLTGSRNRATCLFVGLIAGIGLVISPSDSSSMFLGEMHERSSGSSPQEVSGSVPLFQADINRADVIELQLLPGIGPKSAEEILRVRSELGGFQVLQDLDRVDGIGKKTIEQLKSVIRFESQLEETEFESPTFRESSVSTSAKDRVR